ncbi:hypothetical protein METBIDRAFT_78625 [Metschnikowia bicuspidata var. bicuspidata NRRL YB-4993]|uniref:Uncharacterized protein n=1 Tax=Metschnikowia bicuspidata var. bicuspidata NRRL YB-4993 TaxID=869754 RepID=A0A1A0HC88_9ASCO|nr:hypothetical protein METBIDRAFT_78625 [Metschnikowia bicuspidata var. bicuspidata NRRL YB-4993]OBA21744.1 hypothetical protein METBIDRAFT_78625 [Metschnikowia bicuspidata var. bicuspidata NRRL YB-4993]
MSNAREPFNLATGLIDDEDGVPGKLAPFGGFSRSDLKDVILGNENIFLTAPWTVVKSDRGNGSLFNAINLAVGKEVIDHCKWVGAMALPSDLIPQNVLEDIADHLRENYDCESVLIDDMTFQGHYKSFCKQVLWPTLHYQIPDDPKSKAFEEHSYHFYKLANQLVADRIVETYREEKNHLNPDNPENMIWIHDYHLLLVPAMVREQCPEAKIGFFLHVSFPSSEVFRCLAQRKPLLEGLLGADCICFLNEEYVRHFLQTCSRILLTDLNELGLIFRGKVTRVQAIPVGVDATNLESTLKSEEVCNWRKMIRDRWLTQSLIVSRDKLDKLRGIKQKLLAYERYLLNDRKRIENTVLLQIFKGETKDDDYEAEVLQIISRINSMADNLSATQPVIVLHHDIDFDQYLALQAEADLFIVSSMREGLNLTCHEFIIATSQKKASLVLSEFTGSSPLLDCNGKGAFLINPWDISTFGKTIGTALEISDKEREERWRNCHGVVLKHDSLDWAKLCLKAIKEGWIRNKEKTFAHHKPFSREVFRNFLDDAKQKNLIVINVDDFGAAAVNGSHGHKSTIELSRIGTNLAELLSNRRNYVFFASIMRRSELDLIFKNVPYVGLIAEFGGFIQFPDTTSWVSITNKDKAVTGMNQVARMFQTKSQGLSGSKVVINDCTIRLAAQTAMTQDPKRSLDVMGECVQMVNDSFGEAEGLHATIVNDSVVVQQKDTSLQAFKFLYSFYTGALPAIELTQKFMMKRAESSGDIFDVLSESRSPEVHLPNIDEKIKNIFYAGGLNPLDENIYDFITSLEKQGSLRLGLTVAVWDGIKETRTSAKYVATGQNELLAIISDRNQ